MYVRTRGSKGGQPEIQTAPINLGCQFYGEKVSWKITRCGRHPLSTYGWESQLGGLGGCPTTCARGRYSFYAKGVSINFERSIDFVSRETEGAEHTNLCTSPCDEYGGEGASRIRIREGGNKPLTNTIQLITFSSSFSRKDVDLFLFYQCTDDDIVNVKKGRDLLKSNPYIQIFYL